MLLTWDQYATRWSGLHGGVDPRDGSPMMRGWLRLAYRTGRVLARLGVRPATVTAIGLVRMTAVIGWSISAMTRSRIDTAPSNLPVPGSRT